MFKIEITEEITEPGQTEKSEVVRYMQMLDLIDLRAIMAAVNKKPRAPRTKKEAKQ